MPGFSDVVKELGKRVRTAAGKYSQAMTEGAGGGMGSGIGRKVGTTAKKLIKKKPKTNGKSSGGGYKSGDIVD